MIAWAARRRRTAPLLPDKRLPTAPEPPPNRGHDQQYDDHGSSVRSRWDALQVACEGAHLFVGQRGYAILRRLHVNTKGLQLPRHVISSE